MRPRLVLLLTALSMLSPLSCAQSSLLDQLRARPARGQAFDAWFDAAMRQGSIDTIIADQRALADADQAQPGDAMLLALILDEAGRDAEALDVLRVNAKRFPADGPSLVALANACAEAGLCNEHDAVLSKLTDLPASPERRLERLRQLAIAKQSHGTLRDLRVAWVKHQTDHPQDAFAWLALAVVQARAGEDAESRRCVYEASRLRPKDMDLLNEIARREAGFGFIDEALRTLDAADAVQRSARTAMLRCQILLGIGEQSKAVSALAALTLPEDADLSLVLATADAFAQKEAWAEVARWLEPVLAKHPSHYQLHYVHAIALEESGQREAAAAAFTKMLALDAEIPFEDLVWSARAYRYLEDGRLSFEGLKMPPGTLDLLRSNVCRFSAYNYRSGGSGVIVCYAYAQAEDHPEAPFIALPPSLREAKLNAVAHLHRLLIALPAERRAEAEKMLGASDFSQPALMLEGAPLMSDELLATHPRDLALHAARLLGDQYGDRTPVDVFVEAAELFREDFPQLAFLAASRAYHATVTIEGGQRTSAAFERRAVTLALAGRVPSSPQVIESLLGLLPRRYGRKPDDGAVSEEELRIMARATDLAMQLPIMSVDAHARLLSSLTRAAIANDDFIDAIRLVRHVAQHAQRSAMAKNGLALSEPVGAELTMPTSELGIANPVLVALAGSSRSPFASHNTLPEPRMAGARALLAQVPEPDARRVMELLIGDLSGVEAEIRQRLAKPKPTHADHMLAAWFAQQTQDGSGFFDHLAAAEALTKDNAELRIIDHAALRAAARPVEQLTEQQRTFVSACIQRRRPNELHPAFVQAAENTLRSIGSAAEIERATQRSQAAQRAQYDKAESMPYARSAADKQRQARDAATTQQLVTALKARDLPAIADLGRRWLRPYLERDGMLYARDALAKQLGGNEAFSLLLNTCKPDATGSEASHHRYARLLSDAGKAEAAAQIYAELAQSNPDALLPRLHLAFYLADSEPDKALAQLQSIRLKKVGTDKNYSSVLPVRFDRRVAARHRIAVATLIARWIASSSNPTELSRLLDGPNCTQLIQLIERDESSDGFRFPALNMGRENDDFFVATGESAVLREQARKAHDELCKALLRLAHAKPMALAALASLVINDGGDLSECARFATDLLRDPTSKIALQQWLTAPGAGGERFAGHNFLAVPSPMTILVRHAAQTKDFAKFEKEGLPLIEKLLGDTAATNTKLYARLYSAPEDEYPAVAAAWLSAKQGGGNPSMMIPNEVINVWRDRGLGASLTDLLLSNDAIRAQLAMTNVPEVFTQYLSALAKEGRQDEALAFATAVRDRMIGSDPVERRRAISEWQEQQARYRSESRGIPRISKQPEKPSFVYPLAGWLKRTMRDPHLVCLLPLAFEDDLLGGPEELSQLAHEMMQPKLLKSQEAVIALAEQLGFLAGAAQWRNYVFSTTGNPRTWLGSLANVLRDKQDTDALRQMLAARQPQTLGCEMFSSLLVLSRSNVIEIGRKSSEEKRDIVLTEVLNRRQRELADIAPTQRRAFSLLLRSELPGYPDVSKLAAGLAAALRPFLDTEADDLLPELDRILAAKEWTDVGMRERDFSERFPTTLAQAARRHPAKVEEVIRHGIDLLHKIPEYGQQRARGWTSDSPPARFLWYLGQVPQVLTLSMSLAEAELLPFYPSWCDSFSSQLTDYELMRNRDLVAAIFTNSPFVADAEHFGDYVVRHSNDYDGVTMLDKAIAALNHEDANAAALRKQLEAVPPTFGVQWTLALLESAAPIRKIKGWSNTARRDPAPIIAFVTRHAHEFAKLKPASATAVLAIIERYVKPDAIDSARLAELVQPLRTSAAKHEEAMLAYVFNHGKDDPVGDKAQIVHWVLRKLASADLERAKALYAKTMDELTTSGFEEDQRAVSTLATNGLTMPSLAKTVIADAVQRGLTRSPEWMARALATVWPPGVGATNGSSSRSSPKRRFIPSREAGARPWPADQAWLVDALAKSNEQTLALDVLEQLATEDRVKALSAVVVKDSKSIVALPAEIRDVLIALLYWALDDEARHKLGAGAPELRRFFDEAKTEANALRKDR